MTEWKTHVLCSKIKHIQVYQDLECCNPEKREHPVTRLNVVICIIPIPGKLCICFILEQRTCVFHSVIFLFKICAT